MNEDYSLSHGANDLNISKLLIGYYGYWVKLTYLSVISAVVGMYFALGGNIGYAIICLVICGLCDMFDGPVARLSKRTAREENYGIQIDALADIISFGIFPVVIGYAVGPHYLSDSQISFETVLSMGIAAIYLLTALIRLAYFNVIEIELKNKDVKRTYYEGLPVTFVAIIIPLVYSVCLFFDISLSSIYDVMLLLTSVAFVIRIKVPKLKGRQLFIFLLIGLPIIIYLFWNIGARI
ncbi:MAG: CDP-alcohol phosphatidyltransferase family protein [Bacteroidales bacterium]|jgi:CDP-diacylglycerol--serine O-phosphatidyltransferase|nr:CDP-alcohol phosphatidyltransferase family protein [Bacteroidales bacterium]